LDQATTGAILGFWGESTRDIFAVGGDLDVSGGNAVVLRYDGSVWNDMTISAPGLWWAHGFGPDDVYAVGEQGTLAHWNGTDWTVLDTGSPFTLWGIWGASPTEMWAVGGDVLTGGAGVLRGWDGVGWTDVTSIDVTDELFFKVWGSAADDVFVVGDGGTILHYDGTDWTTMDSGTTQRLITVYGRGPGDVYAVGGLASPVLLHYNGSTWNELTTPFLDGLMGVWTTTGSDVVVAGFRGFLGRGDGDTWEEILVPTNDCLHAVWGDGSGFVIAGGGDLLASGPRPGVIVGTTE